MNALHWECQTFDELSNHALYNLLVLRQRVFVVEQRSTYLDADGHDPFCLHLVGTTDDVLVAAARILPRGLTYATPSIGRIVVDPAHRGGGLGNDLVSRAVSETQVRYPGSMITIGAQTYPRDALRASRLCGYWRAL